MSRILRTQDLPGGVADVASIHISILVIQIVSLYQRGWSPLNYGSYNRIGSWIELIQDLLQRPLKQIADDNSLAQMKVSQRIDMDPARIESLRIDDGYSGVGGSILGFLEA